MDSRLSTARALLAMGQEHDAEDLLRDIAHIALRDETVEDAYSMFGRNILARLAHYRERR